MTQSTPKAPSAGLPKLREPRSWFTFRGRMSRAAFWAFYALVIAITFVATFTMSAAASLLPVLNSVTTNLFMMTLMVLATLSLCAAMVRRLRDCGLHWSIVALSMASLIATTFIFQIELTTYALNKSNGTLEAWLGQRFPALEISGAAFLGFSIVLFWGLTRKGRGS